MRKLTLFLAAICISTLFFLLTSPIKAQESLLPLNLTLSPAVLSVATEPGKPVTTTIKVLNNNPVAETLKINFGGFGSNNIDGKPNLFDFSYENPERNWITANPSVIQVEPFSWQTVEVTFHPDALAAFSYYYSIMFERTQAIEDGATNPVVGIPAILLLTTVESPNMIRSADLVEFTTAKKVYEFLPADFFITVKNEGNVHVAPIGNIFIHQGDKKNIGSLKVNESRGYILPNSIRKFEVKWEDGFPLYRPVINEEGAAEKNSDGTTKYKLEWNPNFSSSFRIGKFTADLVLIYDDGQRDVLLEKTVDFWIIPWKLLLLVGVIALLLIIGLVTPVILVGKKALKKR